jgi:hypothetical protein
LKKRFVHSNSADMSALEIAFKGLQQQRERFIPNPKRRFAFWNLGFGASFELGTWDLEFPRSPFER